MLIRIIVVLVISYTTMYGHAHTFLRARPVSQNAVLEQALYAYDTYHNRCCTPTCIGDIHVQPMGFYTHSFNNHKRATFFLPHAQRCMTVGLDNISDISSPWLGIITPLASPFRSIVTLRPERQTIGAACKVHIDFNPVSCTYPWLSIFIPVIHVRHKLHLKEKVEGMRGVPPGFEDARAAFNNPAWCFGRLSCKTLKKTGCDDIDVQIGCDIIRRPCENFGVYGELFIPTGGSSKARHLFEPTIGNGNHVGLGIGLRGDYCFRSCGESSWTLLADARAAYFFKHKERRSFDLCGCDWSRYLLVCRIDDLEQGIIDPLPGINFFTRSVEVTPRGMIEGFFAFHFRSCRWNAELGYDVWWHQKEKICIPACEQNIAIFDIAGACPPGRTSASTACITGALPGPGGPVSDAQIVPFQESSFNRGSAEHPTALSSTVYAALSYDLVCLDTYKGMIGGGLSCEWAHSKGAFSTVGLWLKGGVCF